MTGNARNDSRNRTLTRHEARLANELKRSIGEGWSLFDWLNARLDNFRRYFTDRQNMPEDGRNIARRDFIKLAVGAFAALAIFGVKSATDSRHDDMMQRSLNVLANVDWEQKLSVESVRIQLRGGDGEDLPTVVRFAPTACGSPHHGPPGGNYIGTMNTPIMSRDRSIDVPISSSSVVLYDEGRGETDPTTGSTGRWIGINIGDIPEDKLRYFPNLDNLIRRGFPLHHHIIWISDRYVTLHVDRNDPDAVRMLNDFYEGRLATDAGNAR